MKSVLKFYNKELSIFMALIQKYKTTGFTRQNLLFYSVKPVVLRGKTYRFATQ